MKGIMVLMDPIYGLKQLVKVVFRQFSGLLNRDNANLMWNCSASDALDYRYRL